MVLALQHMQANLTQFYFTYVLTLGRETIISDIKEIYDTFNVQIIYIYTGASDVSFEMNGQKENLYSVISAFFSPSHASVLGYLGVV